MIVFRADASSRIGNGHVARCLTLAHALRERGVGSVFVCRMQAGEPSASIKANGFESLMLPHAHAESPASDSGAMSVESLWPDHEQRLDAAQTIAAIKTLNADVSWIVSDHYGLGAQWQRSVGPYCERRLVIDDLANRRHECEMLLDQNYYAGFEQRYDGLVPPGCRLVLGPRNVLLRPEFHAARARMRERDGTVRRILVTFGSSDWAGETNKALLALRALDLADVSIDVVVGAANPRRDEVRRLCASVRGCNYHEQIDYMARLILDADLGLGAGGATTWERCALGLPTLTIVTGANQLQTTVDTAASGAIVFLGESQALHADDIAEAIAAAVADPARNRAITLRALSLMPTLDGAERLAQAMSTFSTAGHSGTH